MKAMQGRIRFWNVSFSRGMAQVFEYFKNFEDLGQIESHQTPPLLSISECKTWGVSIAHFNAGHRFIWIWKPWKYRPGLFCSLNVSAVGYIVYISVYLVTSPSTPTLWSLISKLRFTPRRSSSGQAVHPTKIDSAQSSTRQLIEFETGCELISQLNRGYSLRDPVSYMTSPPFRRETCPHSAETQLRLTEFQFQNCHPVIGFEFSAQFFFQQGCYPNLFQPFSGYFSRLVTWCPLEWHLVAVSQPDIAMQLVPIYTNEHAVTHLFQYKY